MPDPAVDPELTITKWFVGVILAGLGTLVGIIYNKHEKDFDKLSERVDRKADAADVHERLEIGGEKFLEMITEIRNLTAQVHSLNTTVLVELGKRPTREEMATYCQTMHERRP